MNRDDIIRMAREVDPVTALLLDKKAPQGMDHETFVWFLERFAALVRADERIRFADKCIDIVAFNGGSVEIEADIRSLAET